jgi:hypothetical protein
VTLFDWLLVVSLVVSIARALMFVVYLLSRLRAPRRLVYRVADRLAADRLIRSTRGRSWRN